MFSVFRSAAVGAQRAGVLRYLCGLLRRADESPAVPAEDPALIQGMDVSVNNTYCQTVSQPILMISCLKEIKNIFVTKSR